MKKVLSIIMAAVVVSASATVMHARAIEFCDGVYRGEKWEFVLGLPRENNITVIPQDRPEPKVYGNGYVARVGKAERPYEIMLLGN